MLKVSGYVSNDSELPPIPAPHFSDTPFNQYYELKGELGKGGFGTVLKAKHHKKGIKFAVKIMKKSGTQNKKVIEQEIEILQQIRHQHIVNLHEIYEYPNQVYLVLDLASGGELFDKIVELEHFTEEDARATTQHILNAISYLHEKSIVHRDLKPENILLAHRKSSISDIKVADFGSATKITPGKLLYSLVGTIDYQGPEMLNMQGYGTAVDLYSLGCILYIMLCGYPPEQNVTFSSSEWDVITTPAKEILMRMLEHDPSKRITARQALNHPFIRGKHASSQHLGNSLSKLPAYNAKRKFHQAVVKISTYVKLQSLLESIRHQEPQKHSITDSSPPTSTENKKEQESSHLDPEANPATQYFERVSNSLQHSLENLKALHLFRCEKVINRASQNGFNSDQLTPLLNQIMTTITEIDSELDYFKKVYQSQNINK